MLGQKDPVGVGGIALDTYSIYQWVRHAWAQKRTTAACGEKGLFLSFLFVEAQDGMVGCETKINYIQGTTGRLLVLDGDKVVIFLNEKKYYFVEVRGERFVVYWLRGVLRCFTFALTHGQQAQFRKAYTCVQCFSGETLWRLISVAQWRAQTSTTIQQLNNGISCNNITHRNTGKQ